MNRDDIQISGDRPRPGQPSVGGPGAGAKEAAEAGGGSGRVSEEHREPVLPPVPVPVHINKDRH